MGKKKTNFYVEYEKVIFKVTKCTQNKLILKTN